MEDIKLLQRQSLLEHDINDALISRLLAKSSESQSKNKRTVTHCEITSNTKVSVAKKVVAQWLLSKKEEAA
jgi:hypothetical protein